MCSSSDSFLCQTRISYATISHGDTAGGVAFVYSHIFVIPVDICGFEVIRVRLIYHIYSD